MPDVLIRNVSDQALSAVDAKARRLGLSRNEYLRRQLLSRAGNSEATVTVEDFRRFSTSFADLADPEVMKGAWDLD